MSNDIYIQCGWFAAGILLINQKDMESDGGQAGYGYLRGIINYLIPDESVVVEKSENSTSSGRKVHNKVQTGFVAFIVKSSLRSPPTSSHSR
jgi:hypothetical protein